MHIRMFMVGLALACLTVATAVHAGPPVYRITDIGLPDGSSSVGGTDLNELGQVAGSAYYPAETTSRAIFWDGSQLRDLSSSLFTGMRVMISGTYPLAERCPIVVLGVRA